jgi:hypothetical protein
VAICACLARLDVARSDRAGAARSSERTAEPAEVAQNRRAFRRRSSPAWRIRKPAPDATVQATEAHRTSSTPKRTGTPDYESMRSRRSPCPGSRVTVNLRAGQRSDDDAANARAEVGSTSRCGALPMTSHGLAGLCSMTV